MKILLLLVILLFSTVSAFDVIRDAFRLINETVNPCDNFYRHACPASKMKFYVVAAYEEKLASLAAKSAGNLWKHLEFEKTLKETDFDQLPTPINLIGRVFRSQCENPNITIAEREHLILTIQQSVFGFKNNECTLDGCITPLVYDKNCSRAEQTLVNRISSPNSEDLLVLHDFHRFEKKLRWKIEDAKTNLHAINAILDGDIRNGVNNVKTLVENLVNKLADWIKNTPWAKNSGAVDAILHQAQQLYLYDNHGKTIREHLNFIYGLEQAYLKCLTGIRKTEDIEVFCLIMIFRKASLRVEFEHDFFNYFNAMNNHPKLYFSFILYDMAQNVEELAAVLGSVGSMAGHEVSHTVIENANSPELITYFSNDSTQCVQEQYQKTCDSFEEISCKVIDKQIDENGSDILGMNLAYSLFEDAYSNNIHKEYLQLPDRNITVQQLFFYSSAFLFCSGNEDEHPTDPHSPLNIRVNAMMQHPEFRNAFQCGTDTRMVESFSDECVIFGKKAPEIRR